MHPPLTPALKTLTLTLTITVSLSLSRTLALSPSRSLRLVPSRPSLVPTRPCSDAAELDLKSSVSVGEAKEAAGVRLSRVNSRTFLSHTVSAGPG